MLPTTAYQSILPRVFLTNVSWNGVEYLMGSLAVLTFLYLAGRAIYNIYIHPLSDYPGPKLAAVSRLYECYYSMYGIWPQKTHILHEKYGDVVRIGPNKLSYIKPEAFNDIYGTRHGRRELEKDLDFYNSTGMPRGSILNSSRDRHSVLRRCLSHGFSDKSLREQESVIRMYADLCIEKLKEEGKGGMASLDIAKWYNCFTFDVMGDLVFGESFNCLSTSDHRPWFEIVFESLKLFSWDAPMKYVPLLKLFSPFILPKKLSDQRQKYDDMSKVMANARIARDIQTDLMTGLLKPDVGVTRDEIEGTARFMITAGSETTATALSGAIYFLLSNPSKLEILVKEVRETFISADQITLLSVNKLEYLCACLNESIRLYPTVPESLPRTTGEYPDVINGKLVPAHTLVGVPHVAAFKSPKNFIEPDKFIPERWLINSDDKTYRNDNRNVFQPFSIGPRNCIGKHFAYVEMRLMLTLVIWYFDLELMEEAKDWINQKIYLLWEKKELMVKLHPRNIDVAN